MANDKLQRLLAQEAALKARIQQERNRENERQRKQDTRRKILLGAMAMEKAGKSPEYKAAQLRELGEFLTRPDDRALFGLPPLPGGEDGKTTLPRNGLVSMEAAKPQREGV